MSCIGVPPAAGWGYHREGPGERQDGSGETLVYRDGEACSSKARPPAIPILFAVSSFTGWGHEGVPRTPVGGEGRLLNSHQKNYRDLATPVKPYEGEGRALGLKSKGNVLKPGDPCQVCQHLGSPAEMAWGSHLVLKTWAKEVILACTTISVFVL